MTSPHRPADPRHGRPAPRPEPQWSDPRHDEEGRRIFTEDDLTDYFEAVDPRVLARDRRRRHWWHAIVLTVVALLVAAGTVTAWQVLRGEWTIPGWEAAPPPEPLLCPAGTVEYALDSTVTVYNGTSIGGLAGDVANALEERDFVIGGVGNKGFSTSNMVAVVVSGKGGRGTSLAVQRNIEGAVYLPDRREDDTVDVIVGRKYKGLRPAGDVSRKPGPLDCQRLETESPSGG
ncbi:LytR family transcriptional regulator [Citricoccus sp. SGAir0253]|uniref:LytR C-terminal domain-containing protein n=1 Tax=Citricoccus sp. SGAir0253 TaxID=2567881 RepID=UPI0010CD5CEA|nr:LytR C-terminal domain-containing protein [Citricoccus sp. SGAir0253]QCU79019.1 LytR family transcriptional regulator [Citricoccus sp. SGAir0253]